MKHQRDSQWLLLTFTQTRRRTTSSDNKQAAVLFLSSLDLVACLRAYICGRIDSGHWSTASSSLDGQIEFARPEEAMARFKFPTPELRSRIAGLRSEKKNSMVRDTEFHGSTMSKYMLKLQCNYSVRRLCEENGRLAIATGMGRGGLSIQILCYSPRLDNRVNHLE
ncbi:hypothetical protein CORC01_04333 [Colletotrichum orchidophilum]|uniref:Uncharacterized protein n=1 Tax=Colletotrichum orchidophilum TaxID=1209926 RepID=A0A1G4BFZ0_9PEZI|nr:uncharacterized protein CORC01_04333 [Colletotrichum orchidophilum]OHF00352.1 hypothetical protein CORC01_04333 [Colletotrichum orchidophilum]